MKIDENVNINVNAYLGTNYDLVGLVFMENGCCPGRPVLITMSPAGAYSTQCACGGWCSNGHQTATAAVKEYEHMNRGLGIWDASMIEDKLREAERHIEGMDAF